MVDWNSGMDWNGGMECQYHIVQNIRGTKLTRLNSIRGKRFVVVPCQ